MHTQSTIIEKNVVTNRNILSDIVIWLKRPQIDYRDLAQFDENAPKLEHDIIDKLEINIKYEGYIKTQTEKIEQMKRLEEKLDALLSQNK